MDADLRKNLLDRLDDIKKLDGKVDTGTIYKTFCEALRELLLDNVYMQIPLSPISDVTEDPEYVTEDG